MKNTPNHYPDDAWENRELGATEEFVKKVAPREEKAIDESLGLHMISIRLQKEIIEELKELAQENGIGYQPYIRQLLTQHVRQKKKRSGTYG